MPDVLTDLIAAAAIHRRSIRKYESRPVDDALIRRLLELAGRAPSAWNLQPWHFVVVRDPEVKARLHGKACRQPQVESAPAIIVLYSDMADSLARLDDLIHPEVVGDARVKTRTGIEAYFAKLTPAEREAWGRSQAYIALGYLLLLAEAHGVATSPMLGFNPSEVKALLSLPDHVEVPALIALGYGDEPGAEPHREKIDSLIRWS